MSDIGPIFAEQRRAKRAFAVRMKHGVTVTTTLAYAMLGGALWEPLFHSQTFKGVHYLFALIGMAALALSFYIAPMGEVDDVRL